MAKKKKFKQTKKSFHLLEEFANPVFRYRLFGMCGSWEEYWYFDNNKENLRLKAIPHLKYGHDAHLEDTQTGRVWNLSLKDATKEN